MPEHVPRPKAHKTVLRRLNLAWEPLRYSLTLKIFGVATVIEGVAATFEWKKRFEELGILPPWAPTLNLAVYVTIVLFFLRVVFLLAERVGEAEELALEGQEKIEAHGVTCSCLHDLIHSTRDDLLAGMGFQKLMALNDEDLTKHLWETWKTQLALVEKAFRRMTTADCNACIKVLKKDGFGVGIDGLITVCYGPSVSIERRKNANVLPANQGVAQVALAIKDVAHSNDILNDERFWPLADREKFSKSYRTVVSSPILINGQAHGVLCLDWKEPDKYSPEHHHDILACFTDLIGTACYVHNLPRLKTEKQKEALTHEHKHV